MKTQPPKRARALGQDGLVDAIFQTAFEAMAVLSKVGAENDLSLTQVRVLAILRDRRVGMTALADHLGLEKSTMSGLVDRAEQRGLLSREPGASDGRAVEVFISRKGAELAERLHADVRRALAPMLEGLTPAVRYRLQALLERMVAHRQP